MRYLITALLLVLSSQAIAEVEYRNNDMEIWVDGIRVHRHHNNKVYTRPYATVGTAGILYRAAQEHRAARAYERITSRLPGMDAQLNGLPLTTLQEIVDDDGVTKILSLPNQARDGYPLGHVMLSGLPLTVERQVYDEEGNPAGTETIDNSARVKVQSRYDNANMIIGRLEKKPDVMEIVSKRGRQGN